MAITIQDLTLVLHGGRGIRHADPDVPDGVACGFFGPNDTTRSTTIRLLLHLLRSGDDGVCLFGSHLDQADREVLAGAGAVVESPLLYPHLSARDNLESTLCPIDGTNAPIDRILQVVDLDEHAHRRVREFSPDMCQRLGLVLALLNRPRVLIADGPEAVGTGDMQHLVVRTAHELGLDAFLASQLLAQIEPPALPEGFAGAA